MILNWDIIIIDFFEKKEEKKRRRVFAYEEFMTELLPRDLNHLLVVNLITESDIWRSAVYCFIKQE